MGVKRKSIDGNIRNDIIIHFKNPENKEKFDKIMRGAFLHAIREFEAIEEPRIQRYAHMMVPHEKALSAHADRFDLKRSLRKYLREFLIAHLGMQYYFPKKEEQEEKKDEAK